jgi:uncharacterized protein (TIGR00369 family)
METTPPAPDAPADDWSLWADSLGNSRQLGLECAEISPGRAVMRMAASPWPVNPNGSLHGGLVLAAADQCLGVAAVTAMDPGLLPATATLNAEFHRPAFAPLTFAARVRRRGRSLMFVEADVTDEAGRLCVHCTATMAMGDGAFHRKQ